MKKDTSHTIKRAERFYVILIGEGLLVGAAAGLVILAYRMVLTYAAVWLNEILAFARKSPVTIALWFVVLAVLAVAVGLLVRLEPMISGSGIPQLEGEMAGKLNQTWWKVLAAKFIGGALALFAGLSLGREGPSIQLGAMVGKGISRGLDRGKTEEKFLLTCGASAGLSAAFHAPLAGIMFCLEEVHKNFSVSVLVSVMTASVTADFLSANILGMEPVFNFSIGNVLPYSHYGLLILLGIILGVLGVFYNWFTLKVQSLYQKASKLNEITRLMIPFMMAGVLGFTMPEVLGSGHDLIMELTRNEMLLSAALLILVVRFIFSAVSFGSGAPGGIFFPLLVLGAFIGGVFGLFCVQYFGMDMDYVNNFIMLAMAGYFTAIVRAPLTGIILIFEMTGSVSQMLSLSVISIVAYIVATLMNSEPIYESLLDRLLKKQGKKMTDKEAETGGQKVLSRFVVMHGASIVGKPVRDIMWPDNCLLVAIQRGGKEMIPKGKTVIQASDEIVTMTDERNEGNVHDQMHQLCMDRIS